MVQNGAFMYPSDSNCYAHTTDNVVGIMELKFDLIWPYLMLDGAYPYLVIDGVETKVTSSWVNFQTQRVVAPFVGGVLYILCYSPGGVETLNRPYEVIMHQPYLPILTPEETTTKQQPSDLDPYELIQNQDKPLLIELTPCQEADDKALLSAENYAQKSVGRYKPVASTSSNNNIYAQIDQQEGYIYLAVQSLNSTPYRIEARELPQGQKVRASEWSLSSSNIETAKEEGSEVSVEMPAITTFTD